MTRNGVSGNGVSGEVVLRNGGVRQRGCQATGVSGNGGVRQRGVTQRVSRDEAGLVWAKFYGLLGLT